MSTQARADALFATAQEAYDGLKNGDARQREKFRLDAEKAERLFGTSQDVLELSPEDVLVDENGAPRVRPQDTAVAWVVVLYNPSCMMSRAVAPLIELAAAQSIETRFAAFACGGHGAEKVEFARKGFAAVFEDPICQALEPGFSESPCCVEIKSVPGAPDISSLSHLSAMTRPCWLRRAVRNRHRHAIEQASRRWHRGRRDDSARTRRKILISTQVVAIDAEDRWAPELNDIDDVERLIPGTVSLSIGGPGRASR